MENRRLRKLQDEEWRQITWADKHYEVSNYGRVKSFVYDKTEGRMVRPGNIRGFLSVSFRTNGKTKSHLVHKITAELFVPKDHDGQDTVIHLDWNKQNNHYTNLQWVTKEDAYKRMFQRIQENRRKSGKKVVTSSKLKPEDVKLLKSMLKRGVKQNIIARLFSISEMQVTRIKRGENWGEIVPDEETESVEKK
jgi:hypothetical protein